MNNRVRSGRIKKSGPRRVPVDVATLQPVRRMAGDVVTPAVRAAGSEAMAMVVERRVIAKVEVAAANVREAMSIVLLRIKAQKVLTHYRPAWRC